MKSRKIMKKYFLILKFILILLTFWNGISIACHEEAMGGDGGLWPTLRGHNPSTRSNGLLVFTESSTAVSSTTTSCDAYTSFLEKNYDQISETIARGNGIFISAIMSYYGCSEVSTGRLKKILQKNFSQIFDNPTKNPKLLGLRFEYILKSDIEFRKNCSVVV
tara:strand:- start:543 stop:1031 length:489 start_codon:yes stop_codon:yes gene_type:complete